jgi:hypothetical protein
MGSTSHPRVLARDPHQLQRAPASGTRFTQVDTRAAPAAAATSL